MGISKRLRFEIFKRDRFTCQYCGRTAPEVTLHVDHVTPRARGGSDDPSNLRTSCSDCNIAKSDVLVYDRALPMTPEQKEEMDEQWAADEQDMLIFMQDPYLLSLYGEPVV